MDERVERRWLLAAACPLLAYELAALKFRSVPTITEVVRSSPRWLKAGLGAGVAVAFTHLFLGKP